MSIKDRCKEVTDSIPGDYGVLAMVNGKVVFERYKGNKASTKFRVFSCSKTMVAMATMMLAQEGALSLEDTLDKHGFEFLPFSDKATVSDLLNHTSGVFDANSSLYFKYDPPDMYEKIRGSRKGNATKFMPPKMYIDLMKRMGDRGTEPGPFKYNNTGYDLLGLIIWRVTGEKTSDYIRRTIFRRLRMRCSFHHERDENESIPYEMDGTKAVKEQMNWYFGNAFISSTLRDLSKFLMGYTSLLSPEYLQRYERLYFFLHEGNRKVMIHRGGGDFPHKEPYDAYSLSAMIRATDATHDFIIITSENYLYDQGFGYSMARTYKIAGICTGGWYEPEPHIKKKK